MNTINEVLQQAVFSLQKQDQARLDAEILLAHSLGKPRSFLHAWPETALSEEQAAHYQELVRQRAEGRPVAYLTGHREFWSLEFEVSSATLIPRPETELLVEQTLAALPAGPPAVVADLGTGSGAIAIALAHERPHWQLLAVDRARSALHVARRNATRLGVANVTFINADWCRSLAGETLDALVANPPYVAERDPHLQQGDVRFEPRHALAAGPHGLDDLVTLIQLAPRVLKRGAALLLEHAPEQSTELHKHLNQQRFSDIKTLADIAGLERVTIARSAT